MPIRRQLDLLGNQILDVDAAITQCAAVKVRFGDLGCERRYSGKAGDEVVRNSKACIGFPSLCAAYRCR